MPIGSLVTVRGLVTNGPELGKVRYLQDHSAGIAAFPGTGSQAGFESSVQLGDSVVISGHLLNYYGLLEISPVLSYEIVSRNRPLPAPKPVLLSQLGEDLESQLVSIDCLSFTSGGGTFSNSGTYAITDPVGTAAQIYLRSGHPMISSAIPGNPVRLQAILSAFGNFQLLPRTVSDFSPATCFYMSSPLQQSEIQQNGFRLTWETNNSGTAMLRYGTSENTLNQNAPSGQTGTLHSIVLEQLQAGTIYWVQAVGVRGVDTVFSEIHPFATQSTSTGQVKIFFNQGIEPSAANGLTPDGNSYADVLTETLNRINSAQQTIDAAIYNNNRDDLTSALKSAQSRGVRVRYIAAESTGNSALAPNPNFPVLYGNSSAHMHNKFLVIDADLPNDAWVMSGSMNWTNANMIQDYNNTLFIQDQSLARTYELEFQEMWGSTGAQPNASNSRFGSTKRDNTPHRFVIGGRQVESYFSPSDQTTNRIIAAIQSAAYQASFAIFTFTKDEIGAAFVERHQSGTWVRGIVENTSDIGAEYFGLVSNGVPAKDHPAGSLLHHKYAVLDAGYPASDPTVVTGSHNWSQAAESENDENTLVIHDANLATLFQAEFERRWLETGTATQDAAEQLFEAYPNPVRDQLFLRRRDGNQWSGTIEIRDVFGRRLSVQDMEGQVGIIDFKNLANGNYFISLIAKSGIYSLPLQKVSP